MIRQSIDQNDGQHVIRATEKAFYTGEFRFANTTMINLNYSPRCGASG